MHVCPSLTMRLLCLALMILVLASSCTRKAQPPAKFAVVDSFEVLERAYVRDLFIEGPYLWVATSEGVLKIDRNTGEMVRSYTTQNGLMVDYAFTVSTSPDGTTWFGTNGGGLARVEGDRVKIYHVPDGLADPWVYKIAYQKDGTMWIATWNGVNRYDGQTFTTYRVEDGLIDRWVYAIDVDLDDSVWFGTEGGLSRFDGKTWKSWTHRDGLGAPNTARLKASENTGMGALKSGTVHHHDLSTQDPEGRETYNENYIFSLLIDSKGIKWIGTWGGGVARFDETSWRNYTSQEGLAGNIVYAIARASSGRLWFGTNHGLSTYDGKSWFTVPPVGRYTGRNVYSLVADPNGSVWIGYKGGVSRIRQVSESNPAESN
jgi:ligand-binding sensor domain-containing protein